MLFPQESPLYAPINGVYEYMNEVMDRMSLLLLPYILRSWPARHRNHQAWRNRIQTEKGSKLFSDDLTV